MRSTPPTGPTPLVIPTGTQVVARIGVKDAAGAILVPRGAVGVVLKAPVDAEHSYRVRFADGKEAALRRGELWIRKAFQLEGLNAALLSMVTSRGPATEAMLTCRRKEAAKE